MSVPKQQSVAPTKAAPKSLGQLAQEALEFVDGDVEKAKSRVFYKLKADKELLQGVIDVAIAAAISSAVIGRVTNERTRIFERTLAPRGHEAGKSIPLHDRVIHLARGISDCLLDIRLKGGAKLRDATHDDLRDQIKGYEGTAGTMLHKARWLRLILQSLPENKTVGDVISEERARELFAEAQEKRGLAHA